ncbi:hypothetical protein ANCDUO_21643, partial [Ancylostoma duodenale]
MLHRRSSLPPEVIALLSGLSQLKLDGNPLIKSSSPARQTGAASKPIDTVSIGSLTRPRARVFQRRRVVPMEFPPSVFLLSTDNFRLIRQLFQTMTSLPVWTEEPCTPYYWAMHLRNRSLSYRQLTSTWSEDRMEREGLSYCREQYEWMIEEMEIYRDLEKNS